VPRNVVTLVPRRFVLPRRGNRARRAHIHARLAERYRPLRDDPTRVELAFPKRTGRRAAKDDVAAELDRIDRGWRRLFVLYPTEDAVRRHRRSGS
jgi:hypothetical protein